MLSLAPFTTSALSMREDGPFTRLIVDDERIGWIAQTSQRDPALRFKWDACGSYGWSPTKEKAIAAVESLVPGWLECRATDKAKLAAIEAMPDQLREAVIAESQAEFQFRKALNSGASTSDKRLSAELEWLEAKDVRQTIEASILEAAAA